MTYLIAITFSVLEGRFPIASLFMCDFFVFVARRAVPLDVHSILYNLSHALQSRQ